MCNTRLFLLACFLLAATFPVYASGKLDSLKRELVAARTEDQELSLLVEMLAYYSMRSHDSVPILSEPTIELAHRLGRPEAELRAQLALGLWEHHKGHYDQAKAHYFQALTLANAHDLRAQLPPVYSNLGITYLREYQQDSAYHYLLKAEQAYAEQGSPYDIWKTYNVLFDFFASKGDTAQASLYAEKAFSVVEKGGSRIDRGYLLFQLVTYFFHSGQFDRMAHFQGKWEAYQGEKKTSRELMESPEHIALFLRDQARQDQIEPQLKRAIQYFDSIENPYRAGWCCEDLANWYLRTDRRSAAEVALGSALTRYQSCGAGYRQGKVLYRLYQLQKENEQSEAALEFLESYKLLADSLFGLEVEENLNEIKIRYETEQKEQALRIQALELDQATQKNKRLIGSVLLLSFLAAGIFFGLRHRMATNRRLAEQDSYIQSQRIQQLEQEKQLASLEAMIEGQEQERLRIANDLHDSLGGLITAAKAHASSAMTAQFLDEGAVELRRISRNLAPRTLSVLGLQGAIEDLAGQLRQKGLHCRLQVFGLERKLPPTMEAMLFRILQELSHNVLKHAAAHELLIQLIEREDALHLILEDDGKGFDLQAALQQRSLGLSSIQWRVAFLKGELDIDTAPGQGTTVSIHIPLLPEFQ